MRLSDAPEFQRNLLLGAVGNDQLLYEYGREVARECLRMGIYVNFAPVLDVNDNAKNPVIGNRSFGESPSWWLVAAWRMRAVWKMAACCRWASISRVMVARTRTAIRRCRRWIKR